MKRMTGIMMIMALATMLTACGGGGESQVNETESSNFAVTRAATVVDGPDTELYTISLLAIASSSYAVALNDSGQVIGHYLDADHQINAFQWQDKTVKTVVTGGQVRRINNHGQIVGWQEFGQSEAFLYEADGTMLRLNTLGGGSQAMAINDAGVILLKASGMTGARNLLLDHGVVTDLANFGSNYAVVNDLNSKGQIVGWMADAAGAMHAFLATPKS
ncbi:MAG: hypothetical protein IBX46_08900 [Desulfuromonadales bacterium]|nr:hypothetical protein [Desulfuromonadales bacterium]